MEPANTPGQPTQPDVTPPRPRAAGEAETDAASRSLADALRVSFRLLSLVMIVAVVFLLRSGVGTIQPEERAVRVTFGRIQGKAAKRVLGEGLRLGWPRPIGEFVRVSTKERTLQVDDLWLHETGQDTAKSLRERRTRQQGLRPGYDGALMTGDRGLIHIRIRCTFKTGARRGRPDNEAVIDYLHNVSDTNDTVRSAVCDAAIRAAAARTLESIYPTALGEFAETVRVLAQHRLDELRSGISIQEIRIPHATVPLTALNAFDGVAEARSEWEARTDAAKKQAVSLLNNTVGPAGWPILVGQLERRPAAVSEAPVAATAPGAQTQPAEADRLYQEHVRLFRGYVQALRSDEAEALARLTSQIARFGLLDLYARARDRGKEQQALADEILEEVHRVLLSNRTTGSVASILNQARSYSAGVRETAKSNAARFNDLLVKYRRSPELMMERLWADAKTEILTDPTVEKFYFPPDQIVKLRVSSEPDIQRQIRRELLRAGRQQRQRRSE